MTKTRNISWLILVIAFSAICALAQGPDAAFDAAMAKKTGADENGMRSYVFCILKTGPKDAAITDKKERSDIFAGHMANMSKLAGEGKLALAGPFGKNDRQYRGIFIFSVATIEEAQKLVETDPVIKSGMMVAELTPWFGSAATMLINENHKKVAKKNM